MAVTSQRVGGTSSFALMLDGGEAAILRSYSGGVISAEVVTDTTLPSRIAKKHISLPRFGDIEIQVGPGAGPALNKWVQSACAGAVELKNGSIVSYDVNMDAKREIAFVQALITEVTFPAMDASSKDACYLKVKLTPEQIRTAKASGKLTGRLETRQERWVAANFRLRIDGLDCSKVISIDPISVKRRFVDDVGQFRMPQRHPSGVELSNLSITIAESGAATWLDWFDDFVVKGNNDDRRERTGDLTFLSANMQTELGKVSFSNLGICRLALQDTADETPARVTAELYYEDLNLQLGPA